MLFHLRTFVTVLSAGVMLCCSGQVTREVNMVMRFDPRPSEHEEKLIYEALHGLDPNCTLTYDKGAAEMTVRSEPLLRPDDYVEVIHSLREVQIAEWTDLNAPADQFVKTTDLQGFPLFERTGDPVLDERRYQQAKQAWIAANPEQYKTLLAEPDPRP